MCKHTVHVYLLGHWCRKADENGSDTSTLSPSRVIADKKRVKPNVLLPFDTRKGTCIKLRTETFLLLIKNPAKWPLKRCVIVYVCITAVGDDSLESALKDEETLCMDMVYDALDWYKKAVIETREIDVR